MEVWLPVNTIPKLFKFDKQVRKRVAGVAVDMPESGFVDKGKMKVGNGWVRSPSSRAHCYDFPRQDSLFQQTSPAFHLRKLLLQNVDS